MANNTHKYGFRVHRVLSGAPTPPLIPLPIASAYQAKADDTTTNVDLNIGDPVGLLSTGYIELANATDLFFGVIMGFTPYWNGTAMTPTDRLPGGTTYTNAERTPYALVAPASSCLWEIDVDEATTATTWAAYLALMNENVTYTCAGDVTNADRPKADPRVDISTHATTAGLELRLVRIAPTLLNADFSGTNVKVIVAANATQEYGNPGTPVVGV